MISAGVTMAEALHLALGGRVGGEADFYVSEHRAGQEERK